MRGGGGTLTALAATAAVAALTPATAPARAAHRADGRLCDWKGTPTNLSGRTQLSRGELIYTDYLLDDYGPNLDGIPSPPSFRSQLANVLGDYRYPDDPARLGWNAADLRELRLVADGDGLHA